jgi:hypothetical protein
MLKVQITRVFTLNGKIAIDISESLYAELELRVKRSNGAFKSVEDYVEFVLREFVKQDQTAPDKEKPSENEEMAKRLRRLGYM